MTTFTKTNNLQFQIKILGPRKPVVGEQFDIEMGRYKKRVEVECLEVQGDQALVERTDGKGWDKETVQSRLISEHPTPKPYISLSELQSIDDYMDYMLGTE